MAIPVVVAEVRLLWHQDFLLHEDGFEVFLLHPVGQVDVTADFILAVRASDSEEEDGCHSAVFEVSLPVLQRFQELVANNLAAVITCQSLELLCAVLRQLGMRFLALEELLMRYRVTLAVESQLNQLSGELLVFQVE